jgi:hypothetical protein
VSGVDFIVLALLVGWLFAREGLHRHRLQKRGRR